MKIIVILATVAILSGCTGHNMRGEANNAIDAAQRDATAYDILQDQPAALYVTEPPADTEAKKVRNLPAWANENYSFSSSQMPFFYVAEDIVKRHGVHVGYGSDIDINQEIGFSFAGPGSVYSALEGLAATSGYHFEIHGNQVTWSAYVYEHFDLAYVGGKYNYLIGNEAGDNNDSSQSAGQSVEVGANTAQYSNVTAEEQDLYKEIEDTLTSIVADQGQVIVSKAAASAIVTATPARMKHVRSYMEEMTNTLARAVVLEFKVIKFTSNIDSAVGIDWSLLKETLDSKLVFNSNYVDSVTQTIFAGPPISFGAARNVGDLSGSELFVKALEEQGRVSIVTEPKVTTMVNRVAVLEKSKLTGYIARTEVTAGYEGQTSVEIQPGTVKAGYSIYAIANVDKNNRVYLHVSSNLSDLIGIQRKDVGTSAIETPNFTENSFSQTSILKSGNTMVLNGLSQNSNSAESASPFHARWFPTYKRGGREIEETLVLVTPTVINMGSL